MSLVLKPTLSFCRQANPKAIPKRTKKPRDEVPAVATPVAQTAEKTNYFSKKFEVNDVQPAREEVLKGVRGGWG